MVFRFPARTQNYYILQNDEASCALSQVVRQPGLKDDQSLTSIIEVKDVWSYMACIGSTCLFRFPAKYEYIILFDFSCILIQQM
jgi:hypothetical protein